MNNLSIYILSLFIFICGVSQRVQAQSGSTSKVSGIEINESGKVLDKGARTKLESIAQQYIQGKPTIYFDGQLITSLSDQLRKIGYDLKWFMDHEPGVWFISDQGGESHSYSHNHFEVSWRLMPPGCVDKGNYWATKTGTLCMGGYGVSVLITKDFKPDRLDIYMFN